ncbi:MAG: ABC transporter permease [Pseudomonadota bacterium]
MKTWHRFRYRLDFVVASLGRRPGKTLSLLGVYTGVVALLATVLLYSQGLKEIAARSLVASPDIVVQRLEAGRHALIPASHLERLGRLRGVTRIEARLWGYHFDPAMGANATVMAPAQESIAPGSAHVGATLARVRGLAAGDVLSLRGQDGQAHAFSIAGVLPANTELVSGDLLLVSPADYRALFAFPEGVYTDFALTVANPAEVRGIARKIAERLPDSRPILREEILRTYESVYDWRQGLLLVVLSGALLAFLILAWDKATGLSAEERREIGILKAIGWDTGEILRMKLVEGGLVSLTAYGLGYALAHAYVFHADAPLFASVMRGWSVLQADFTLPARTDPLLLGVLFLLSVVPYTVATLVPAWRAASVDPDSVLR